VNIKNDAIFAFRWGRKVSRLRRVVVCVGGGYRVDSRAGYPSVSLVTKLAEVKLV
jgi:hypothetical protein